MIKEENIKPENILSFVKGRMERRKVACFNCSYLHSMQQALHSNDLHDMKIQETTQIKLSIKYFF